MVIYYRTPLLLEGEHAFPYENCYMRKSAVMCLENEAIEQSYTEIESRQIDLVNIIIWLMTNLKFIAYTPLL